MFDQPVLPTAEKPPLRSLLTTIVLVILGFGIIGPLIGFIVASIFYGSDVITAIAAMDGNPDMFYPLMIVQGVTTLLGMIAIPYFQITTIEHKKIATYFPSQHRLPIVIGLMTILSLNFVVAMSPVVEWNASTHFPEFLSGFEEWARAKEDQLKDFTEAVTNFASVGDLLLGILVIAVLPAIGEELVFRGLIQRQLTRASVNPHLAIWLTAIIFSAIHLQFFGFVPRVLLGALFGYLYLWSGNLLIPILAHFFNNAFSVVALYLSHQKIVDATVEEMDSPPVAATVVCAVITTLLLFYLYRFFRENNTEALRQTATL